MLHPGLAFSDAEAFSGDSCPAADSERRDDPDREAIPKKQPTADQKINNGQADLWQHFIIHPLDMMNLINNNSNLQTLQENFRV